MLIRNGKLLNQQVGEFKIRSDGLCKIQLKSYKGHQRVDLRNFYEAEDGTWQPTPKGLNIASDDIPTLNRLVDAAERMLVEAGQLDPADFEEESQK